MQTSPPLRAKLEVAALWAFRLILFPLPPRAASWLGACVGGFLFHVVRLKRGLILGNLKQAFGNAYSAAERKQIAARCYQHFGAVFFEFLIQPRLTGQLDKIFAVENPEVLEQALADGRGVMMASGHLGNWELMGSFLAAKGYPYTIYVGRQHNLAADAVVNGIRRRMGIDTLAKSKVAMRGMVKTLKDNRILGFLSDQHFSRNRHFVRFFGYPVSAPPGLGLLTHRLQPQVIFAETYKVARLRYRTRFIPIDPGPSSGDDEFDLLSTTQKFMDILEGAIRRSPEQYFWMHRTWRPPPAESMLSAVNRAFLAGEPPPTGTLKK